MLNTLRRRVVLLSHLINVLPVVNLRRESILHRLCNRVSDLPYEALFFKGLFRPLLKVLEFIIDLSFLIRFDFIIFLMKLFVFVVSLSK